MIPSASRPVPVFPLPDVVLFPHARLPLHVFELRYRTLVRDALSGPRTLAIATLRPGWEGDYHGSPAFHDLGCLARFEQVEWLPNDCYDLKLVGVERVRFQRVAREFPYRACVVEPLPPTPFDADDPLADMERRALLEAAGALLDRGDDAWIAPPLTAADAPFETVVNTLAHALRVGTAERLELLAFDSVFDRARRLHEHLEHLRRAPRRSGDGDTGRN
jgi:Lon protease-like protein